MLVVFCVIVYFKNSSVVLITQPRDFFVILHRNYREREGGRMNVSLDVVKIAFNL